MRRFTEIGYKPDVLVIEDKKTGISVQLLKEIGFNEFVEIQSLQEQFSSTYGTDGYSWPDGVERLLDENILMLACSAYVLQYPDRIQTVDDFLWVSIIDKEFSATLFGFVKGVIEKAAPLMQKLGLEVSMPESDENHLKSENGSTNVSGQLIRDLGEETV